MNRVEIELQTFQNLKQQLKSRGHRVVEFDETGFCIAPNENRKTTLPRDTAVAHLPQMDLLLSAITHGDEVIGLEATNLILEKILNRTYPIKLNLGFILNNVPAALAGVRFLETDLNRSFDIAQNDRVTREHMRAVQIEKFVPCADFILDYHQTVEPSEQPFFIFQHHHDLVELAHTLAPELPIVTFPKAGFSRSGRTINEHAGAVGVKSFTIEWGEKGFNAVLAQKACEFYFKMVERIEAQGGAREMTMAISTQFTQAPKAIAIYHLLKPIPRQHGASLNPGWQSFMQVKKNQALGQSPKGPILAHADGRVFFPKYGRLAETSPELCELGEPMDYKDL